MDARESLKTLQALLPASGAGLGQAHAVHSADTPSFFRFLVGNHLAGTLYWILQETGAEDQAPRELVDRCKLFYLKQWGKNQTQLRLARQLRDAFAERSVDIVFLKGIFLAQRFYGSIEARATSDLDVLVRRPDIARAEEILRAAGFIQRSRVLLSRDATIRFTHHFEYVRDSTELELHWALAEHPAFRIRYPDLWDSRQQLRLGEERFSTLSDEYALVTQVLGAFKDIELGVSTLKPFVDLYWMLPQVDTSIEWSEFFDRRRAEGIARLTAAILGMTLALFDCATRFPGLSECAFRHNGHQRIPSAGEALALASGKPKHSLENRRWAWALYELNPLRSLGWWLASLPFRVAMTPGRQG